MSDASDHFLSALRLAAFFGISGSIFALGFAMVCRALNWAPINITVNVNDYRPGVAPDDDVGTVQVSGGNHE
jgi:hypothetical protein